MYEYVPVHTSMYWYILKNDMTLIKYTGMYLYMLVNEQTCINQYVRVHTRTVCFLRVQKKVQNGLEPVIFCILLPELTP